MSAKTYYNTARKLLTGNYNPCYVFIVEIQSPTTPKSVYISSDHGGFELKNYLATKLANLGYQVIDLGPKDYNPNDDYPDTIRDLLKVFGERSQKHEHISETDTYAIVICRNGVGVSIMANKTKGVRCALSFSPEHARSARQDDNANFLALPADYISKEIALQTTLAFLETPFSNQERHIRRLAKLEKQD